MSVRWALLLVFIFLAGCAPENASPENTENNVALSPMTRSVDPEKLTKDEIKLIFAVEKTAHVAFASAIACPSKNRLAGVEDLYRKVYEEHLGLSFPLKVEPN